MENRPFPFKFFYKTLGYRKVVKGGKSVFSKKLRRHCYSIIEEDTLKEEYEEVCNRIKEKDFKEKNNAKKW